MNVYDSERMTEALGEDGYEKTLNPDEADMILLNTCHIREKAAEKVYSELGRFKELNSSLQKALEKYPRWSNFLSSSIMRASFRKDS